MALPAKPTITAPPATLPTRNEDPVDFSNNINSLVQWYPSLTTNLSGSIDWIEASYGEVVNVYDLTVLERLAAVAAKTASEDARDLSQQYRNESLGFRNESEDFRDGAQAAAAAAQSAAGLPSLAGNAGLALIVNQAETTVEWGRAVQNFYQEFTASGNFEKDPTSTYVMVHAVGGGAGGGFESGVNNRCLGTGGEGWLHIFRAEDLPASVSVVVGLGGVGTRANGGDSSFNGVVAKGGTAHLNTVSYIGLRDTANALTSSGSAIDALNLMRDGTEGFCASGYNSGNSTYGGGGGNTSTTESFQGVSTFAGNGGLQGENGAFPGGGGGGFTAGADADTNGGDGVVRVWQW